ncbi:hypothetical protein CFB89_21090 [Burkholderia sp. AU16741]|nr:hypothetical protein CFB89_21090 [Burkholderia sp. AU16741]
MSNEATRLVVDQHVVHPLLIPGDVIEAVREAFVLHGQRAARVFRPNVIAMIVLLPQRSGNVPKRSRKT